MAVAAEATAIRNDNKNKNNTVDTRADRVCIEILFDIVHLSAIPRTTFHEDILGNGKRNTIR